MISQAHTQGPQPIFITIISGTSNPNNPARISNSAVFSCTCSVGHKMDKQ